MVLLRDRRRVIHFNVAAHPTARWTEQQVVAAFPYGEAPRFLLRDRVAIYSEGFQRRVEALGIEEVVIAFRSPWLSPHVEWLIGSIRRECLDHVIVLNRAHLLRILTHYFQHYHRSRTHLSFGPRGERRSLWEREQAQGRYCQAKAAM